MRKPSSSTPRKGFFGFLDFLGGLGGNSKKRKGVRPQQRRAFGIEPLEERQLLSVCHWTGGSHDNNLWSTQENWSNGHVPTAGDSLIFDGKAQTDTYNDLNEGTSFASITFASDNFTLSGSAITLNGGITIAANSNITTETIALDGITLDNSITVTVASCATLTESSDLFENDSYSLTKTGYGTLI